MVILIPPTVQQPLYIDVGMPLIEVAQRQRLQIVKDIKVNIHLQIQNKRHLDSVVPRPKFIALIITTEKMHSF